MALAIAGGGAAAAGVPWIWGGRRCMGEGGEAGGRSRSRGRRLAGGGDAGGGAAARVPWRLRGWVGDWWVGEGWRA